MTLTAALLSGCGSDSVLWLLRFEALTTTADDTCEVGVSHNFTGAEQRTTETVEGLITTTLTRTVNDSAVVAEMMEGTNPVLVIANNLWIGEKDGSNYKFKWEATEKTDLTEVANETDYVYSANLDSTVTETIDLEISGKEATGTYKVVSGSTQGYSETDEWDQALTGVNQGQIPSGQYLDVANKAGGTVPAQNMFQAANCDSSTCELDVDSSCTTSVKLTGTELTEDGDAYDSLEDASRPAGIPGGGGG